VTDSDASGMGSAAAMVKGLAGEGREAPKGGKQAGKQRLWSSTMHTSAKLQLEARPAAAAAAAGKATPRGKGSCLVVERSGAARVCVKRRAVRGSVGSVESRVVVQMKSPNKKVNVLPTMGIGGGGGTASWGWGRERRASDWPRSDSRGGHWPEGICPLKLPLASGPLWAVVAAKRLIRPAN
jgi:hypothetical protein